MIASASGDKTAKSWNLDGKQLKTFTGHTSYVSSVAFSPDGKMIATASGDKTAKLWSLNGKRLRTFQGHDNFNSVAFSPDGKMIATGSHYLAELWNINGK